MANREILQQWAGTPIVLGLRRWAETPLALALRSLLILPLEVAVAVLSAIIAVFAEALDLWNRVRSGTIVYDRQSRMKSSFARVVRIQSRFLPRVIDVVSLALAELSAFLTRSAWWAQYAGPAVARFWGDLSYAVELRIAVGVTIACVVLERTAPQRQALAEVAAHFAHVTRREATGLVRVARALCRRPRSEVGERRGVDEASYVMHVYLCCVARLAATGRSLLVALRQVLTILRHDAQRAARVARNLLALVLCVVAWVLWARACLLYEGAYELAHPLPVQPPPLSWEQQTVMNRDFDGVVVKRRQRWRHTLNGEVIRIADWCID
ncbi:hypothetical protein GGS23DRAFT_24611 [Durotheca rogersii]|uniref:uncharacterized protein n=1 Tax=Durotheca rogersii TaxID=419775 RepID=UPI00221F5E28|nr:uncharacterized protein GGS23DRAFT_24611 [Durotheca rogersii]KAI5868363.1 hypothetical protein GGS23DRAFT_24611 [Durotheca rogersii]